MKASTIWLQKYFDEPLPPREEVADAYTFHAFEIDSVEGTVLDVKVLPNRAADCLAHRGLAKELAAILDRPLKRDPLREPLPDFKKTNELSIEIEDPKQCPRYMGALVKDVKVRPSPDWLRQALESVGQRSVNNIVDATNYVLLDIGQPLHAFDAGKLIKKGDEYAIGVRAARAGERITTLANDTYELTPERLIITDANTDAAIAIAGVKGGKAAEIGAKTTDIIIEAANFDGTSVRRTAQALKLVTDASLRFQNRPSPELCAYAMRDVLALIHEIAGGEVTGIADEYPTQGTIQPVKTTRERINSLLGSEFTRADIENVFRRLSLPYVVVPGTDDTFEVTPPFERTDLVIPEDIAEEVGRILGYERIAPAELPLVAEAPDQARYRGIERMKDQMVEAGFTEVSTQSFAKEGDVYLANPLDKTRPALRTSLEENLNDALVRATRYAPLVLPPNATPKLFEVGTVFPGGGEYMELRMTEAAWPSVPTHDNLTIAKLEEYGKGYEPVHHELGQYMPFSNYPFVLRDIALWTPADTAPEAVEAEIRAPAGDLLARLDLFDTFEKEGRVSYAFRLVFESTERTLTDAEVNGIMEKISAALTQKGYEIR